MRLLLVLGGGDLKMEEVKSSFGEVSDKKLRRRDRRISKLDAD
jgi:hypothetical protein